MRSEEARGVAVRPVAVLSDASDFRRRPGCSVLTGLLSTAALLHDRTGMTVTAQLVTAGNTGELATQLRRVAPALSGAYLVHTDPVRARAAQVAVTDTLAVITDRQTTAVALVAAALTTLARAGTAPAAARLVIAGTERNPLVAALAVAAGIGEIDSWGPDDVHDPPWRRPNRRGAVVIDLLAGLARGHDADGDNTAAPVLTVDEPATALLALPALLGAAQRSGCPPGLAGHVACALALVAHTPPGRVLPDLSDPGLTDPSLAADIAGARRARGLLPVR